jgi:uncharacterized membrane protein (DUF2068 family)
VAAFEAGKGLLVLASGLGLLSLLHRDVQHAAESIVKHLHLNPARHYPRIFLEAAGRVNDRRLWWMAAGAFAYATVRGVEAYGLWRARVWAEWVAILGGALYLPIEIYGLVEHATAVKLVVFLVNLGIVAYVVSVRFRSGPRVPEPARRPG